MQGIAAMPAPLTYPGLDLQAAAAPTPGAGQPADKHRIQEVAQNFESLFVSILLKEMRQSVGPNGMFGSDKSDVYGGLFDMYLGQHLAQSGAFGIARMVSQQLERSVGR